MKHPTLVIILTLLTLAPAAYAQTETGGQVEIPLAVYNQLVETARDPRQPPRPAPASYAIGSARVSVVVAGETSRPSAEVRATLTVEVLEDDWVLVPVLPAGTPVEAVTVDGAGVQLVATPHGLAWAARKKGSFQMALTIRLDSTRSDAGLSLAIPVPRAASMSFEAQLPGTGLDVAVIPSAATRATASGQTTRVRATIPTTAGVQLSWRLPAGEGHVLSRARYTGSLKGDAVTWSGELAVELLGEETATLPLLPSTVTLRDLKVDGKDAIILLENGSFATLVRGRGRHTVTAGFETPVVRRDGPPRIELAVPRVPVSRFELTLPGKKEVTVSPASNVTASRRGASTVATAHVPLTSKVSMSWAEAVPEEIRTETRANASVYHAVHAEEGVLYVHALAEIEVTRGETNVLRFQVPAEVQVDRVSASGAVADWRLGKAEGATREVAVFLDRQLQGRLVVEIGYDRSIDTGDEAGPIEVPLMRSLDAQRQRGMVALLSGPDLALRPATDDGATRVGENQLPAFVRDRVELAVAHTYKYVEEPPELTVEAAPPERQQGRFDAEVDTLISLGEVTMKGSASVEIDVKSGRIMELTLTLPAEVNLLGLTGPSVRQHQVSEAGGRQDVAVEFTQEMEGQFRLELAYERLLLDGDGPDAELDVPTLGVPGAEVEQGRIAVEALSAVEVRPAAVEQLTSLDAGELPQQLVLRTTNPILLAYKYVNPPHRLALTVTRHEMVAVHEAAIDRAEYRTLFTRDGLSVTAARFEVRNSRRQFLRLELPPGSELWSAFVDGRAEKPARTVDEAGREQTLIKIIHSTDGFPVELVFETPVSAIQGLGKLSAVLPRPEILVTRSRWDVYLPEGVEYGEPSNEMELVSAGQRMSAEDLSAEMARMASGAGSRMIEPLRPVIPSAGIHYAFEKLYANQGRRDAGFEIPYASGLGRAFGRFLSLVGASIFWVGLAFLLRRQSRLGAVLVILGTALLALLIGHYQLGAGPAVWLSMLLLLGVGFWWGKASWERNRAEAEPV
ncbi:MAG: hypothetical protein GY719_04845 [bacterium]|nr:hypothetical protein [bacterium]